MNEFLIKVFGWTGKGGGVEIVAFNIWHFIYLILIAGAIIGAGFALKGKSDQTKKKVLNILSICVLCWYIAIFFMQPFINGDNELNIDKLPFHICTLMSIVAVFAQFSKKDWFKETAVTLAMAGALMYLTYPASAFGGAAPWAFKVIETMLYHGALLAWGILSLTTGQVKLHYKNMWMPLVGVVCIAVWATIDNVCYNVSYLGDGVHHHYDWFFLTGSSFPFPPYLMPFLVIVAVYGVIACFYLINYVCQVINKKLVLKKVAKVETGDNAELQIAHITNADKEETEKSEQTKKQKPKKE